MPEFKDMLKYFRAREGLSQRELAEKLGISVSAVSMYEVGKREPDFETEEKIADFFNTDLNTLRGHDNESYYLNDETKAIAQEIYDNPDMKSLFDMSRKMTPERLRAHVELMKQLVGDETKRND